MLSVPGVEGIYQDANRDCAFTGKVLPPVEAELSFLMKENDDDAIPAVGVCIGFSNDSPDQMPLAFQREILRAPRRHGQRLKWACED